MARRATAFVILSVAVQAATLNPTCAGVPEEVGVARAALRPLR